VLYVERERRDADTGVGLMVAARGLVNLVPTCLVNEFHPDAGMAIVRVLERLGFEVTVPDGLTCCGQPAYNAGFHDEARRVARHTLAVLAATDGPIVIPSGSCSDMAIHQYAELFGDEPALAERARAVAARCREFSQFVAAHGGADLAARLTARVAYHPSCHLLRGLGVRDEPQRLLRAIDGVEPVAYPEQEECCGFGGLFSIKHADISGSMLDRKLTAIAGCGADRLVSCDLGCLLHIEGGLRRRGSAIRTQHLAELIDEALS
jgi:L-lactate dehydrogenase complex protein LldE